MRESEGLPLWAVFVIPLISIVIPLLMATVMWGPERVWRRLRQLVGKR